MTIADPANFAAALAADNRRWYWSGCRVGGLLGVALGVMLGLVAPSCSPVAAASTGRRTPVEDHHQEPIVPLPDDYDSGVTRAESAELARIYADAARRLRAVVLKPSGLTVSAQGFRQARAAELAARINVITRDTKQQAAAWVGRYTAAAARRGRERAEFQARAIRGRVSSATGVALGDDPLRPSFAVIDAGAVAVIARDTAADLYAASEGMERQAARVLRVTAQVGMSEADINRVIAGGIILGEPTAAIRTLRQDLRHVHGETVEITDRNGDLRHYAVNAYAETVARTRTREATVAARHERLAGLGLDLVRIVGRVSDTFCTAFLGQVFSLSGTSDRYPAYSTLPGGGPPFHPRCSKSTAPFVAELADADSLKLARGKADAGRLLGMPADQAQRAFKDLQLRAQVETDYRRATQA